MVSDTESYVCGERVRVTSERERERESITFVSFFGPHAPKEGLVKFRPNLDGENSKDMITGEREFSIS